MVADQNPAPPAIGGSQAHFWLTVLYSALNLAHLVVDLTIPPIAWYQIVLMALLFGVGLVLNGVAYRWARASHCHPVPQVAY